jgi:cytochrome c551
LKKEEKVAQQLRKKKNERRKQRPACRMTTLWLALFSFCFVLLNCGKKNSAKFNQYYAQGEKLYLKHCSNCHQADGTGLGRLYPPLHVSDFMEQNLEEVICLIRHGKRGEVIVNGNQYNLPMPGIELLSDLEIAEIATYIYNTWSHERGIIQVKDASEILQDCPSTP